MLTLTIVLMLAGLLFILCEIFLPGGVAGIIGCLLVAGAIVSAFSQNTTFGVILLGSSIVLGIVGFWAWLKYLPQLPGAKRMFHTESAAGWSGVNKHNVELIGKEGVTMTVLRPSGFAEIDGERVDVVTEGGMIEAQCPIKVIEVEGNRIVVAESVAADS